MRFHPVAAVAALLLTATACSPTFNWREWRVEGTPLLAVMPCKPESAIRPVPLGGAGTAPVELHMHSCEAGDLRFAVAWAEVGQTTDVATAQAAWRAASLQTIRASGADWPASLPGAQAVQGVRAEGTDPQGRLVQARMWHFAQGQQLFQVAVYGQRLPDETVDAFFAGLKIGAP